MRTNAAALLNNRSKTALTAPAPKAAKRASSRCDLLVIAITYQITFRRPLLVAQSHPCVLLLGGGFLVSYISLALVFLLGFACCSRPAIQMGRGHNKTGVFTKRDKRSGQGLAPKTKLRKGKSTASSASTDSLAARNVVVIIGGVVAAVLLWLEYKGY